MGEKSTVIRDQYADELRRYMDTVPVVDWPIYRNALSRSGLADAIKDRGFSRFDRKRLQSNACRPIVKEMEARIDASVCQLDRENQPESEALDAPARPALKQTHGDALKLERALAQSEEEAKRLKSRCNRLVRDLKHVEQQQSAFEKHCRESLRTLHV
jgi:hypothetical protein